MCLVLYCTLALRLRLRFDPGSAARPGSGGPSTWCPRDDQRTARCDSLRVPHAKRAAGSLTTTETGEVHVIRMSMQEPEFEANEW